MVWVIFYQDCGEVVTEKSPDPFLPGWFKFQVQRVPRITLRAESQLWVLGVPSSLLSHSGRAMGLA